MHKIKIQEKLIKKLGEITNKFEPSFDKCKFGNFGIKFKLKKEFDSEQDILVKDLYKRGCWIEKTKIDDKFKIGFVDVDYSVNRIYFFIERIG